MITLLLIVVTSLTSISCFSNSALYDKLILHPYTVKRKKQWYRLVTSGFQHADYQHLIFNMLALFLFGRTVELYYNFYFGPAGPFVYLALYLTSIAAANLSTYYRFQDQSYYHALGASGAVSAVVFTSILFDPAQRIYFVPGIIFGIGYLAYSYYSSKQQRDHVNHEAHFYGAIYGILFTLVLKPVAGMRFIEQLPYLF